MEGKMKKKVILFVVVVYFLEFVLSSCASIKILTPEVIESDIGGLENLVHYQFYISKDVTLIPHSDNWKYDINETSGTVKAQQDITKRTIKIANSTPGILQTKNSTGEDLLGYRFLRNQAGNNLLDLFILFEDDNDNAIFFRAISDKVNDKFELNKWTLWREIDYDGLTYTITYEGDEQPYLRYELLKHSKEQNEVRKAKGRKVGS
jgi:hypothetical protein